MNDLSIGLYTQTDLDDPWSLVNRLSQPVVSTVTFSGPVVR